jgi:DNA-binding Lrp family transcriptional regulator
METVFSDLEPTISVESYESKLETRKPLRSAFVFINAEPDSFDLALEDLRQIEGVTEVFLSHGAYDIVAKVTGESMDHLREMLFKRIKNLSSIKSNLTLTVIDDMRK